MCAKTPLLQHIWGILGQAKGRHYFSEVKTYMQVRIISVIYFFVVKTAFSPVRTFERSNDIGNHEKRPTDHIFPPEKSIN